MGIGKFLAKWGFLYILGFGLLFFSSYLQTRIPSILGDAIDLLAANTPLREGVMEMAALLALVAAASFAVRFMWRLLIIGNARHMEIYLRNRLYAKLQRLPMSFFRNRTSGDLMAYAINDIGAVRMTFGPIFAMAFNSILVSVMAISGMIGQVELKMTLIALIPVPFALLSTSLLGMAVQKRSLRVQKLFSGLSGFVNESIAGVKVIKSFARENEREAKFDSISSEMRDANVSLVDASALINPLVTVAFGLSYAIALILGGNAVVSGKMSAGTLVTFLGFLTLVQNPVTMLGNLINRIQRGIASYKRLAEIFDSEDAPEPSADTAQSVDTSSAPTVKAECLRYRYPEAEHDRYELDGISFEIPAGGSLGICGTTGSGKTTVLNLISKLCSAENGQLFINGTDIRNIPSAMLRGMIGYVPQDGFLFSASISDNIALGAEPCEARVQECARTACIYDEIAEFPDGFATEVGERGTHLSGGQKQRVSLARALYRQPKLLLLDDTLSAVDNITERRLIENLGLDREADRDVTRIIVSHRLSALEHCDEIIYMENGRITERGTHASLMALGGAYADTFKKQAKEASENE